MKKIIITEDIKNTHFNELKEKLKKLEVLLKRIKAPYSLRDILLSKPEGLYEIGQWSKKKIHFIPLKNEYKQTIIYTFFNVNFDFVKDLYKNFTDKNKQEYNAYDLAKSLNVNTCPYCNINSIYTIVDDENNKKIVRPEFDHFFDKATYPILALSLYNLIPSCHQCNSNLKGQEKFNLESYLHPYSEDIDKNIKFKIKITNAKFYYSINGFEIDIDYLSHKAVNHNNIFKLKERYNYLKDIILELIQKKYMYNEDYLDSLFKKYEGTFFRNKEDLMRLISGGYISESEINKRPLSKLIKDISEELGLI